MNNIAKYDQQESELLSLPSSSNYGSIRRSATPRVQSRTSFEPRGTQLTYRELKPRSIKTATKILVITAYVTFFLAILEFIGAMISRSICLIVHSTAFWGVYSRVVFLIFVAKTCNSSTAKLGSFRQYKWDIFLCTASLLIMVFVLGGALYASLQDLFWGEHQIYSKLALLITGSAALIYSIGIAIILNYASSGAASRKPLIPNKNKRKNLFSDTAIYAKERGLMLRRTLNHVEASPQRILTIWFLVQSVLALILSLLCWFFGEVENLDSALALFFAFLPATCALLIFRDLFNLLLEGVLKGIDFSELAESLLSVDGVVGVRHLRIWSLSMDKVSVSVNLSVESGLDPEAVLMMVAAMLERKFYVDEFETLDGAKTLDANTH